MVPKVLTKICAGETVELKGDELEKAKLKYSKEIEKEITKKEKLNDSRKEIKSNSDGTNHEELKSDGHLLKKKEAECTEVMHPKISEWKESFTRFLSLREFSDPPLQCNKAFSVLRSHYDLSKEISIDQLLDPRNTRQTLCKFREKRSTRPTSKIQYVKLFLSLINFVVSDFDSPEYAPDISAMERFELENKLKSVQWTV